MGLKFDNSIKSKDINIFLIISLFVFFLSFTFFKGFIKNEEVSDIVFIISCFILVELSYLLITNQKIYYNNTNKVDFLILFIFFSLTFIIWNSETIFSYKNVIIFFLLHFIFVIFIIFFLNLNKSLLRENNTLDFYLQISILTFFFSGLFFQINYSTLKLFPLIIVITILVLFISFILNKLPKWVDLFLASLIFLILFKVFLLSSPKDAFHYSWFLGPINSISDDYKLLDNLASQYGYLNIFIISKLGELTKIDNVYVFINFILILFIIFFSIFFSSINKNVKLPITIIIVFLCYIIFGNNGYANLSGSMFIPSSSVFRFLPSLITIILFSEVIKKNIKNNLFLFCLTISILISFFWSFESFIFTIFSLGLYLFANLIFIIFQKKDVKQFLRINFKNYNFKFILFIFFITLILLIINKNNFTLFYEHAFNSKTSLSKEILNNKVTLVFLYMLTLGFLIVRDGYKKKNLFSYNLLWFGLLTGYSLYFLVRSVDNNFFNIFPYIVFIICSMETYSNQIKYLRLISIYILIFFTIISSSFSILQNKDKFLSNLFSLNYYVIPNFLSKDFLPPEEIQSVINKYKNVPLTLVSGTTIHHKNINLPSYGYGLPILPLEHFNILKVDVKQNLIDNYFEKNKKHLLLCIEGCEFYKSNEDSNYYSKIFIGENINVKKIFYLKAKNSTPTLYILSKKNNN